MGWIFNGVKETKLSYTFIDVYDNFDIVEIVKKDDKFDFINLGVCNDFTYIMEDTTALCYKIGRTKKNPNERLKQFQTGNPSIKLILVLPHCLFGEVELQNKFILYQKKDIDNSGREWFFKTEEIKNFVSYHLEMIEKFSNLYKNKKDIDLLLDKIFKNLKI